MPNNEQLKITQRRSGVRNIMNVMRCNSGLFYKAVSKWRHFCHRMITWQSVAWIKLPRTNRRFHGGAEKNHKKINQNNRWNKYFVRKQGKALPLEPAWPVIFILNTRSERCLIVTTKRSRGICQIILNLDRLEHNSVPWLWYWENNIKMDLLKVASEGMDCIDLAQDRDRWKVLVNGVMNLRVPQDTGNSITIWGHVSFSGNASDPWNKQARLWNTLTVWVRRVTCDIQCPVWLRWLFTVNLTEVCFCGGQPWPKPRQKYAHRR